MPTIELSDYLQAEIFLEEVFKEEPEKIQLLFGMGTTNLLVKGDLDAAKRDFGRFRELDVANRYGPYHVWAEDQLEAARKRAGTPSNSAPARSRQLKGRNQGRAPEAPEEGSVAGGS